MREAADEASSRENDILSENSTESSDSLSETSSKCSDSLSEEEHPRWPLRSTQSLRFIYNKSQVEELKTQIDKYLTSMAKA